MAITNFTGGGKQTGEFQQLICSASLLLSLVLLPSMSSSIKATFPSVEEGGGVLPPMGYIGM